VKKLIRNRWTNLKSNQAIYFANLKTTNVQRKLPFDELHLGVRLL